MQVYGLPMEIVPPEFSDFYTGGHFDIDGLNAAEDRMIADLAVHVTKIATPHPLNGKVVRVPYADGAAQYMVAKIGGKVSLIHLPLGDAWQDGRFERTATVAELTRMVKGEEARAAFFAKG